METFRAEKPESPETRNLQEPDNPSVEDWWRVFETFLKDVDHLAEVRTRLEELKKHLQDKNQTIKLQSGEIHEEIQKNLDEISLFQEEMKMQSER